MNDGSQLDTLSLMSIQHELAMNISLDPEMAPLVRRIMKICLRRLSVKQVCLFWRYNEEDVPPQGTYLGPEKTFYFQMPEGVRKDILKVPELGDWIVAFFQHKSPESQPLLFSNADRHYHAFPLGGTGVLVLERLNTPLPEGLVQALVPAFERLNKGCQAAMEHGRIILEMDRRRIAEKRIEYLAYHDDLTKLANRRQFLLQISKSSRMMGPRSKSALLYIGLDNFKDVNDSLGHEFGDGVLRQVANRLLALQDESTHVARVESDEFGVLISTETDCDEMARQEAINKARSVLAEVEQPNEEGGRAVTLSASIGIVMFSGNTGAPDTVISMGGAALRKAKLLGRNTIHFHDDTMNQEVENRLNLDAEMRDALKKEQFELYLQPQVDDNGEFIGAETLIRWQHPQKGLVSPAAFIPMAEQSGFIVPLSDWILERACRIIKQLHEEGLIADEHYIAVNLSAKQFYQADFVDRVEAVLMKTGISPSQLELELELTEGTLLEDVEDTIEKMRRLKNLGIRFSIDDFGTGYSSLAYLKRLPIDRIKIDQTFVMNVDKSPDDAAIVDVVISMARHFNLEVIAEGIETQDEYNLLKRMGCKEFQGYLFYRPMPMEDLIKVLSAGHGTLRVNS